MNYDIIWRIVNRNKYNNISTQPTSYNVGTYTYPSPQVRIARQRITSRLTNDGSSGLNDNTAVVFLFPSAKYVESTYLVFIIIISRERVCNHRAIGRGPTPRTRRNIARKKNAIYITIVPTYIIITSPSLSTIHSYVTYI